MNCINNWIIRIFQSCFPGIEQSHDRLRAGKYSLKDIGRKQLKQNKVMHVQSIWVAEYVRGITPMVRAWLSFVEV